MSTALLLIVVLVAIVALTIARRRRQGFTRGRSEHITTAWALKKQEKRKKAALDAASAALR